MGEGRGGGMVERGWVGGMESGDGPYNKFEMFEMNQVLTRLSEQFAVSRKM